MGHRRAGPPLSSPSFTAYYLLLIIHCFIICCVSTVCVLLLHRHLDDNTAESGKLLDAVVDTMRAPSDFTKRVVAMCT